MGETHPGHGMGPGGEFGEGPSPPQQTYVFTRQQQRAILGGGFALAVVGFLLLGTRILIDDPEPQRQALLTWGLAAFPLAIPVCVVSLRPLLSGSPSNRLFWRWWFAGDTMALLTGATIALGIQTGGSSLRWVHFIPGALVLPLWGVGGVIMLRQKSGARTVGIDLVDTAVAVVTVSAAGAYVLVGPILGAEDSVIAVPFALCMVGAPAALYLAYANFTRLQPGRRTPQAIALSITAVVYLNVGFQAVNAVRSFTLPFPIGVTFQLATGLLLLTLPLFTHNTDVPGLDRLPLARQVRRASPLAFLPAAVLPFLAVDAWIGRERHPNRLAFVIVMMFGLLLLGAVRSLLANHETRRLYAELEQASVDLQHRASHDELTGLVNRRQFTEVLEQAVARQQRSQSPLALLYVDLDGFKAVNDSMGHKAGDDVLREVASRLEAGVRNSDTVARIGGDEFVVLCESTGTLAEAQAIADRAVHDLAESIITGAGTARLGASVGLAYADQPSTRRIDDLLREADEAMYDAKEAGRGQVRTRVLLPTLPATSAG